jgi:hypothetical protein
VSRNSQGTQRRPLRQQPENHKFGSLLMLAVTAGAFLLVTWVATKTLLFSSLFSSHRSLENDWQGISNAPAQRIDANDPDLASRFAVKNMSLQLRLLRS